MTDEELSDLAEHSRTELADLARSQDSGLARVATALLAWSASNDRTTKIAARRERRTLVGLFLILMCLVALVLAAVRINETGERIDECTGADPTTQCRQQQARDTTPVVNSLAKRTDCVGVWTKREVLEALGVALEPRPDPDPCAEIFGRTDQLEAGHDPFATVAPAGARP